MTFCSTAASEQDRAPWRGKRLESIEDGRGHGTKPAPTKEHHASGICISNRRAACHLANQSATMLQCNSKGSSLKHICLASTLERSIHPHTFRKQNAHICSPHYASSINQEHDLMPWHPGAISIDVEWPLPPLTRSDDCVEGWCLQWHLLKTKPVATLSSGTAENMLHDMTSTCVTISRKF